MNLPVVAVIGLGAMGHAFASNLLKKGFTVHGWNRTPERGEDLIASGLIRHATPQQAAASAEVMVDGGGIVDNVDVFDGGGRGGGGGGGGGDGGAGGLEI